MSNDAIGDFLRKMKEGAQVGPPLLSKSGILSHFTKEGEGIPPEQFISTGIQEFDAILRGEIPDRLKSFHHLHMGPQTYIILDTEAKVDQGLMPDIEKEWKKDE